MEYRAPKGTFDIVPKTGDAWRLSDKWQYVESVMKECLATYGYKEIRTPIFEQTELFVRGVGESSDIVSKEMYTFLDKGERSLTLRPEATAPIIRAFIEERLAQTGGLHKYFYIGPMFRHERPQAGRYRQFHQLDVEAVGSGKPCQDVEVIDLACTLHRKLGLKNLRVMINSIGDEASRKEYRAALQKFLEPHLSSLSAESQVRFSKNILRILDSKDPSDQKLLEKAPQTIDFLSKEAKDHFEELKRLLSKVGISYIINPKLVRGLDYYNKTVFEIVSDELGAQNTICGGGRYDGLPALLGGPDLPCIGFATGIERLLQTMLGQNVPFPRPTHPSVFFIPLGEAALETAMSLLCELRHQGISADIDMGAKKVQRGLELATQEDADYAIVIGDRELEQNAVELKNLKTREVKKLPLSKLVEELHGSRL
ncbi:MAG: histidine--tRNA ligase [Verrucomicrobia bacterium]|nr:histidine--tRNA ligase [Verrucomicrobiota bacterium]